MRVLSEKHSYYLSKVTRPNNGVLQSNNTVNQPNNAESKANNTNIDVYSENIITYLTRTRDEWFDVIGSRCSLDAAEAACIACFGDDEVYNTVLNTILDVLVGGKDVKVGDKVYEYADIAQVVEFMDRNAFADIIGAFCKVNNETRVIEKKQISNLTNYIITLLMIKSNK